MAQILILGELFGSLLPRSHVIVAIVGKRMINNKLNRIDAMGQMGQLFF